MKIVKAEQKFVGSYWNTVCTVAKERIYLGSPEPFPLESTKQFVQMIIENNLSQFHIIDQEEKVVGWCDILPKSFLGLRHVGTIGMGLLAKYRHQGFGSQLLTTSLLHAKTKGIEKVELDVFESNQNAIKFYEKHGFQPEGIRIKGRKLDGIYDNIVLMGKFI